MGKTSKLRLRKADEASARAKALSNALTKGQVRQAQWEMWFFNKPIASGHLTFL